MHDVIIPHSRKHRNPVAWNSEEELVQYIKSLLRGSIPTIRSLQFQSHPIRIPSYDTTELLSTLMSSFSTLSTIAPLRAARTPVYLHLAVRAYSGVAVKTLHGSSCLNVRSSPYTSKRSIHSTPENKITPTAQHHISPSSKKQIKEFFPPPEAPGVKEVASAWAHPV